MINTEKINKYGYCRVSTESQVENTSLETQREMLLLQNIPEENIIEEVASAYVDGKQVKLTSLIENVPDGSIIYVTKLDRLARNTLTALQLVKLLEQRNCFLVALDMGNSGDQDPSVQKLMFSVLSSLAEFESSRRRTRILDGIAKAKQRCKLEGTTLYSGRKSIITEELGQKIEFHLSRGLSVTEISRILKVSRNTVYRCMKKLLGYESKAGAKVRLNKLSKEEGDAK